MYTHKKIIFLIACMSLSSTHAMNLLLPYNTRVRPRCSDDARAQVFAMVEGGIGAAKAYDTDDQVNALRILTPRQNALTMLQGFPAGSPQSQLLAQLNANNDTQRGWFTACGDLELDVAGALAVRYLFYPHWSISAYLPFYRMSLNNVSWQDQTLNNTEADQRVKQLLTDDFVNTVRTLGDGLDITSWRRSGQGDLTLMLDWFSDFPQAKELLKNVRINWRMGTIIPSGKRRDPDLVFAVPFGTDGAMGIIFAMGLDLRFGSYVTAGMDIQLTHSFGRTRTERIKTAVDQTELLLLQKASAYRDFGLTQQFSLYTGIQDLPQGFDLEIGYTYIKHGDDDIDLCSLAFSNEIANSSLALKEWTAHQVMLRADYNFGVLLDDDTHVAPRLGMFARLPFNGKRSALFTTVGLSFACDF